MNGAVDGGTALHVAAANARSECVAHFLDAIVPGDHGQPTQLQALIVHSDTVRRHSICLFGL